MLSRPSPLLLAAACLISCTVGFADEYRLSPVERLPDGLAASIAGKLTANGFRVTGPDGPVCEIWLVKEAPLKAGFKATLSVRYPFTPGQLLGALSVPKGKVYKDFRGQELAAGVYTLRYGQQPADGNHIGTSDTADFLLALPAGIDQDGATIDGFDKLSQVSAQAAGTAHPAIFSLLPAEEEIKNAILTHDEDFEFWILNLKATGTAADKPKGVPIRLVAIGQSDE